MGMNKKSIMALNGPVSPFDITPKAISRRKERRRLLALQRKSAKLNRSIDRLANSIRGSENAGA